MTGTEAPERAAPVAALHHLTGASRGHVSWLSAERHAVGLDREGVLRLLPDGDGRAPGGAAPLARLRRCGTGYLLEAAGDATLWVNRVPVRERALRSGDMIEFGEEGPLSRVQILDEGHPMRRGPGDVLADTLAYLRMSRQPMGRRLLRALKGLVLGLLRETTLFFRVGVLLALLAVAALGVWQQVRIDRLERRVEVGSMRLESFAVTLARARDEALRPSDLAAAREEIARQMVSQTGRLEALEARRGASARVIAASADAVAFLQGAYGFRDSASGRMLRHLVGPDGRRLLDPFGRPLLGLGGDGPVAEREFTGTGFLLAGEGAEGAAAILVTNRHVALPWERDAPARAAAEEGLEPALIRLIAYLPGRAGALDVTLLGASEVADLALLGLGDGSAGLSGLPLADAPPVAGTEVLVMGYPTGLKSMLAQSGEAFVRALQEAGTIGFWEVAARLAEAGAIRPLASRGIVGQVTGAAVIFDAETTHGGSGGPVLDPDGRVIAVQSAILPDYGGSNIGVPVERLRALIDGEDPATAPAGG